MCFSFVFTKKFCNFTKNSVQHPLYSRPYSGPYDGDINKSQKNKNIKWLQTASLHDPSLWKP